MDIDNYDEELEFSSKRKLTKEQIRIRETHALYLQNLEKYSQQKQLLKDLDFTREYIDKKNGNRYVPLKKSYIQKYSPAKIYRNIIDNSDGKQDIYTQSLVQ